jgi:hypothetical protein
VTLFKESQLQSEEVGVTKFMQLFRNSLHFSSFVMFRKPDQPRLCIQLQLRQQLYSGDMLCHLIVDALKNVMYMRNHIQMPMRDLVDRDMSKSRSTEKVKHGTFIHTFGLLCDQIVIICQAFRVKNVYFVAGTNATFPIEGLLRRITYKR